MKLAAQAAYVELLAEEGAVMASGMTPLASIADMLADGDEAKRQEFLKRLQMQAPSLSALKMRSESNHEIHRFASSVVKLFTADKGGRARGYRLAAAYDVLAAEHERGEEDSYPKLAAEPDSHAPRLAEATREVLVDLLERLEKARCGYPLADDAEGLIRSYLRASPPERDGMLEWDATLADVLAGLGKAGAAAAAKLSESARARWAERAENPPASLWRNWLYQAEDGAFVPPAVTAVTRALWRDKVGPTIDRERRKPPALVRPVYADAMYFHSRKVAYDKNAPSTLTFEGRELARSLGATFDLDVIIRGLSLLGSLTAHRLFRWEVMTGHAQHLGNAANANVLEIPGGWAGLTKRLGLNPEKHATDVRAIVKAQAHFEFTFPNGSKGNMLSYLERPARGREQAHVSITLGKPLMPSYFAELSGDARRLVPLLGQEPPLYGRANEHGEQLTMALAIVAELRDRARELVEEGGVRLGHEELTRLADRAGLPRRLIVPVRDHWLRGDTRSPPFLTTIGKERYTLSDAHKAERDFLEEGGRMELSGAAAGVRSTRARRAKIARLGRGGP